MAYQTRRRALLEMFMDRTAGETYSHNRLITVETESGNVALIGYGWLKLAEYNESRDVVTVFAGHKALRSRTVSRWLNEVVNVAKDRGRELRVTGESPTEDTPNEGARYIGGYVSMSGKHSSVEQEAIDTVRQSLADVA